MTHHRATADASKTTNRPARAASGLRAFAPLALAVLLSVPLATTAQNRRAEPPVLTAQQVRSAADLRIRGFDVKPVDRLGAGAELDFSVWGTPGAQVTVRMDGARRLLTLQESSPGYYRGTYVIANSDRVEPGARTVAQLRARNFVTTATLEEALQNGYVGSAPTAAAPDITQVTVRPKVNRAADTQQLDFVLKGTPGGTASVTIPGAKPRLLYLQETRRGEYTGSYIVRTGDRLNDDRPVIARLRVDDRVATSTVPRAFQGLQVNADRPLAVCLECGTVASVQRIEVDGDEGYIGAISGGVLGAVLGSQVGGGDGRKVAGAVGAVGGVLIGREIDKRRARRVQHEVVVRMNDGESRTFLYADEPNLKVGQRVRAVNDTLQLI